VLGLSNDADELEPACGAFLREGRLQRLLDIPSLPAASAGSAFWDGLFGFCRRESVTSLELGTFCSPPGVEIPTLGKHCARRARSEFVLALTGDLDSTLSPHHRRNVRKAQKTGLAVRQASSAAAASEHLALVRRSLDRRRARGEGTADTGTSPDEAALLQTGAGVLFQALAGTTALSSVLILRAARAGYYQSAGTSHDGMTVGASHFLIHAIAERLAMEGAQVFNLGGADEGSSLARFKQGFGASPVRLTSASCRMGSAWLHWASRAIALVR
jgi:hypothetical protein